MAGVFFLQVSHVYDASASVSSSSNGMHGNFNDAGPAAAAAAAAELLASFTERLREALRCDAILATAAFDAAKQLKPPPSMEHRTEVPEAAHGACTADTAECM